MNPFYSKLILVISLLAFTQSVLAARQSGKILGKGTEKPVINLNSPDGGWTVDRMILVSGTVSDSSIDPITIAINGNRYLVRVDSSGTFSRKFPAFPGRNSVLVIGKNKSGTTQVQRSIYSKAPQVPLTLLLTSDTDGIYTDLHVYEPKLGRKQPFSESDKDDLEHIYWAHTDSPSGGKFYLNEQGDSYDQPGYGPYLYTHVSPPTGIYRVDANYWPSGDKAHALSNLNVVLNGGKANEIQKTIKAPLAKPGETVTLAWLRFEKDGTAYVYSPVADPKPKDNKIWPKWVLDFKPAKSESYDGDYY